MCAAIHFSANLLDRFVVSVFLNPFLSRRWHRAAAWDVEKLAWYEKIIEHLWYTTYCWWYPMGVCRYGDSEPAAHKHTRWSPCFFSCGHGTHELLMAKNMPRNLHGSGSISIAFVIFTPVFLCTWKYMLAFINMNLACNKNKLLTTAWTYTCTAWGWNPTDY